MRRREFISLVGGAAATWPLNARAQQGERMRRVGVLMNTNIDADQQASVSAFVQALQQLGWTNGRDVRIDIRWAGGRAYRNSQTGRRFGRAGVGCARCNGKCRDASIDEGDEYGADRICAGRRPGRRRLR